MVGVSCILNSIVSNLCVKCSGSITSVGEERASLSVIVYLWVLFGEVSSSSWMDCVILSWHSLSLPYNYLAVTR